GAPIGETASSAAAGASARPDAAAEPVRSADAAAPAEEAVSPIGAPTGAAALLERAAELLAPVPQLRKQRDGLAAKAAQLRESRFTIALFGAFSAGKSSFANALVGQPALPVSPNPTTATINRIVAPAADAPHGTARIAMKTPEAMREDLAHSLERLGVDAAAIRAAGDDASALLTLAARMTPDDIHPRGRPHLAFLRAAASGWPHYGERLGRTFLAGEAEYRRYVAEEEASCFVASVDLHVDSPLTRSGAVLVDTPGADSINARHTGVAFEYIKNADAVLFVTYYNHAFTEADRGFLNQLGSVKDAFELDKMFFVLNAADLAASPEELAAVQSHVEQQLLKHGIRRPRLFPISSLQALEAKLDRSPEGMEASGIAAFEAAFRQFSERELGSLALAAARQQLARIEGLIDGLLRSAGEDAATRQARTERLLREASKLRDDWRSELSAAAVQPLAQELEEQLYHLRRRVQYRFGEHFLGAFHPSVLQDDGRDLKKLLQACWLDLKRSVAEDLRQELRSAGLRIEVALQRSVAERIRDGIERSELDGFSPELPGKPELGLSAEGDPFRERPAVDARRLWNAFRSPKHFFEKEGSRALRETLEAELLREADVWLEAMKRDWTSRVEEGFRLSLAEAGEALAGELGTFAAGLERELLQPGAEAELARIRAAWTQLKNG
ncbi:dynamin family protein, partial [Cohnella sp. REN36]|uniref:dynamin family protein n=1 Tax=Cohnella sp. REN36 TaxID=2887347 RepID=UPI001D142BD6